MPKGQGKRNRLSKHDDIDTVIMKLERMKAVKQRRRYSKDVRRLNTLITLVKVVKQLDENMGDATNLLQKKGLRP